MSQYKVYIWGTGYNASKVLKNGINAQILGFIQSHRDMDTFEGYKVYVPDEISNGYDAILVASHFSDEIYTLCVCKKWDISRIVFLFKGEETKFNEPKGLETILGESNYADYLAQYGKTGGYFFDRDIELYTRLNKRENFNIKRDNLWPIIVDKYTYNSGMSNYFWQDLWAAKKIIAADTKIHYDIGSRVDGFIAHLLAAGIHVNMIDIRPFLGMVENLFTIVDDATELRQFEDDSIDSLSALCSLEHFGLGRYGDPIDPEACFRCFENIQNKMRRGGNLYISVPVGRERVEFNAHRIFYAETIIECFSQMELVEYSCAAEQKIEQCVPIHKYDTDEHNGEFRYGLFHFVKSV